MTESARAIEDHPYLLNFERIMAVAPKMTPGEYEAFTAWAQEAMESPGPIDTSAWPGWRAVVTRLAH
jgi:hypothetical protein